MNIIRMFFMCRHTFWSNEHTSKVLSTFLFLVSFLYTQYALSEVFPFDSEVQGTNGIDILTAESNSVVFGFRGKDVLHSCFNCEALLMGGRESDKYKVNTPGFFYIRDNWRSRKDKFISNKMSWTATTGPKVTFTATIDKEHLVVFSNSGTVIFVPKWKSKHSKIEQIKLSHVTHSFSFLENNLTRFKGWLGNVSYRSLRKNGVFVISKRDALDTLNFYKAREMSLSESQFAIMGNRSISLQERIMTTIDGSTYLSPILSYTPTNNSLLLMSANQSLDRKFDVSRMNGNSGYLGTRRQTKGYVDEGTFAVETQYSINEQLKTGFSWFTREIYNRDYGTTPITGIAISNGVSVSIEWNMTEYAQLGFLAANERAPDSIFGFVLEEKWLSVDETEMTKLGITGSFDFVNSISLNGWYQYGFADVQLDVSPFISKPKNVRGAGWGVTLEKKELIAADDRLSISFTQPFQPVSGGAIFSFGQNIDAFRTYIPFSAPTIERVYELNYDWKGSRGALGAALGYSENEHSLPENDGFSVILRAAFEF